MTTQTWIPSDTFGSRLLLVRKQKGLTVEVASKLCGLAQPTWTTWENGARPRDYESAARSIAAALDVDLDWLLRGGPLAVGGPTISRMLTPPDLIAA